MRHACASVVRILQLGSVRVRCVLLVANVKVTAYAMIKHTPAAYFHRLKSVPSALWFTLLGLLELLIFFRNPAVPGCSPSRWDLSL